MDKTIGIFGGGQLGRMMAQAALPLNIQCTFFEASTDCPSAALGQVFSSKAENGLAEFIQSADVFSLEFENTPLADVDVLTKNKDLHPPRQALQPSRGGYDGKGQFVLRSADQIEQAWAELGPAGELIAESFVTFSREVSIIAVRGQNGDVKTWPLAENHHHNGILSHSIVPAPNSADLQPVAQEYITRLLNHLNYVGVLTLELFVTDKGLYANEMAPRVHNSGHWSIEGAVCSQFENHVRAVAGLPLGSTDVIRPTVMVNIIGLHPKSEDVLALNGAHLHLYNKTEREGRKIGHITLMPKDSAELTTLCQQLATILPNPLALTQDMII